MGWNGQDFVDELSAKLGDTSTAFETKVIGWVNDGIREIASVHNWVWMKVKGRKTLTQSQEEQDLSLGQPTAASLATSAGGSLTDSSVYSVKITFYEATTGHESVAGVASATATPSGANLTIDVTSIPTSGDPLVTARRVYLEKDSGGYFLYSTISDNTTTTASITADTTDVTEPPDEHKIKTLCGNPYIADTRQLEFITEQQLNLQIGGTYTDGSPEVWSQIQDEKILIYPRPSNATTVLDFYYYKLPNRVYNTKASLITIPEWLKADLERYVIWRGYEYRDRDGQQGKLNNFEQLLEKSISQKGGQKKLPTRVRDVVGGSRGFPI